MLVSASECLSVLVSLLILKSCVCLFWCDISFLIVSFLEWPLILCVSILVWLLILYSFVWPLNLYVSFLVWPLILCVSFLVWPLIFVCLFFGVTSHSCVCLFWCDLSYLDLEAKRDIFRAVYLYFIIPFTPFTLSRKV